jgi:hypothetical protein
MEELVFPLPQPEVQLILLLQVELTLQMVVTEVIQDLQQEEVTQVTQEQYHLHPQRGLMQVLRLL